VWATQAAPWHLPHPPYDRAIVGDIAMIASNHGWVTKLDLRTGKVLADKRVAPDTFTLYGIEHLGNDRYFAIGMTGGIVADNFEVAGFTFDGTKLEGTKIPIATRPDKAYGSPSIAMTTEGLAIGGRGLPLALYDTTTWTVKTIIDPQLGWSNLSARGPILLAGKGGTRRFDLSTNGQRKLNDNFTWVGASGEGVDVTMSYQSRALIATIHVEGKAPVVLPDAITALTIDDTGKRLVTATKTEIRIHDLPGGEIKKRIPLAGITVAKLAAAGSRVVFNHGGVERVVDLDSATLRPVDDGPTRPTGIAVDPDGTVLFASHDLVRMQHGKVLAREPLGDAQLEVIRPDDTRRYATSTNERKTYHLRAFGSATPIGSWDFDDAPSTMWISRTNAMVFDYSHEGNKLLARTKGVNLATLTKRNDEADVMAMDPDGDALIALEGRVAVLAPDGKTRSTLQVPACEKLYAYGAIEIGGPRAATYTETAVAIWDRTTGRLIGAGELGQMPGEIHFPVKREEVLVQIDDRLVFWVPGKAVRTLTLGGIYSVAVSSDGKRIAVGFHDGRAAVYDFDGALAAATPGPVPAVPDIQPSCSEKDPLLPDPEEPDGTEGGEEGGVSDPCGGGE
jgi:sugar lactone lactonase YvrE